MENRRSFVRLSKALMMVALPVVVACSSAPDAVESESVTGTLVQSIGRNSDGSTRIDYHLKSNKRWIRLVGSDAVLTSREPNTRVTVKGRLSENGEQLAVEGMLAEKVSGDANVGQISEALSSTAPKGKVAIFLIKDRSFTQDPYPVQDVYDAILGNGSRSSNSYFKETSYGQFGLTGDIFGWYEADMTTCDQYSPFSVAPQIQAQAAAEDGFVSDNYRHAINIFAPSGNACFLAQGTFGSPDGVGESWSYFNSSNAMIHEIGHNLGLHHANSYSCKNTAFDFVSFSSNCTSQEYNDPYDGMGYEGFYYQWNSYSKFLQGWLPASRQQRVTTAGNYTITPQETAVPNTLQSLVIPTPSTGELLHVELRKQFGAFDTEPRFDGAVLVRRVREPGLYNYTHLLDLSPDGDVGNAGLSIGQTYQDPASGVAITLVSRNATQAVVNVAFNAPSCVDNVKNGSETDVDCGGLCSPCDYGKQCQRQRDCDEGACSAGVCIDSAGGLTGQYYSGMNFETLVQTRRDKFVDFEWGQSSPLPSLSSDGFSVRWSGQVVAPETGTFTFRTDTDDGVRLWVDGQLLIDAWFDGSFWQESSIDLVGGQAYDIVLEYFENSGAAHANLLWTTPSTPLDLIPPTNLIPTATCSADTALDLGPRTTAKTVPSNACVKVSQFPSWWVYTNGAVTLQSGPGNFPVSATYSDSCTGSQGSFTFSGAWQSKPIGNHSSGCSAVIQLDGDGSPLQITWW